MVVVRSVGVPVVRGVEPVPEVVQLVRVGVHQPVQGSGVHGGDHLVGGEVRGCSPVTVTHLVLDCVSGLYVLLEVTVMIEGHPTLVAHDVFGLQMNFVNVLT